MWYSLYIGLFFIWCMLAGYIGITPPGILLGCVFMGLAGVVAISSEKEEERNKK